MKIKLPTVSKLLLLACLCGVFITDQALAYNLQGIRFLPMGDGVHGQQGVILGVTSLIQGMANGLAAIAAVVAVLFIVINGARMTFSFGDSEALSKSRKGLMWSIAGLLLVIFAYVIAKSVVALVYSGEGVGTASSIRSMMTFEANSNVRTCKTTPPLPSSCYGGDINGTQSAVGAEEQCNEEARIQLEQSGVCADMGISGECTVSAVQQKGVYDGLPGNCSRNDGKYGQCTIQAIEKYYEGLCGAAGGAINGTGEAANKTENPTMNDLLNEMQALSNQRDRLGQEVDGAGCADDPSSDACSQIEEAYQTILQRQEEIHLQMNALEAAARHREATTR